MINKQN